jgi:hypothetical protein
MVIGARWDDRERPIWKNSSGNAWTRISRKAEPALDAHAEGRQGECEALVEEIVHMRHNTGIVEEKLRNLKWG